MTVPADEAPVTARARTSPVLVAIRWVLMALLLLVVFGVLVPRVATYGDVWDAITSLTRPDLVLLVVLVVVLVLLARLDRTRSEHVGADDRESTSSTDGLPGLLVGLLAPLVGVALLVTQEDVGALAWALALLGVGLAAVGGLVLVNRLSAGWARARALDLSARRWGVLAALAVTRYAAVFSVLLVSVRAVGVDAGGLSLGELFVVHAVVQVLALVPVTPGGVGVTEALYLITLSVVAEGTPEGHLVGAVLVFRLFADVLPLAGDAAYDLVRTREQRRAPRPPGSPRLGGPRPLLRVLVVWLATTAALGLMAWFLPGVSTSSPVGTLAAAAVLGLLNAVLWPLVVWLALPLTVLTLGLGALVLNGALVGLAARLLDSFVVADLLTGVVVALGVTVVSTAVTSALALDDDDLYYRRVARRSGAREAGGTDVPGVLFLQVDGLGHAVLRRALRDGDAPTLASWLQRGSHRLLPWETDWSSQTGASQAGILLGSNHDMPGFRWFEKDTGRLLVSNSPKWAGVIEAERGTTNGLLRHDGASRGNIFTGGAADAVLTMAVAGRRRGRIGAGYYAYFASPHNATRTLLGALAEVVREIQQASVQRRRDVRPRVPRGGTYPLLRAFTTVVARDVTVATLVGDLYAGRSVVYADFLGYDEVAHHSGVERYDALDTLRRLDREFGRLERAAADAPRPYRLVVLSDHGQSQGTTFETRYGQTLGDVVRRAMAAPVTEQVTGDESWGYAGGAVQELTATEGVMARALRRLARGRGSGTGDVHLGPARTDPMPTAQDEAVVLGSGSLGLVYLTAEKSRMSLEQIADRYPELLPSLVDHPGVGFLLVRSDAEGPVVLGREGVRLLGTGEVRGTDPLAVYGPSAPRQVSRTDMFPHCADIMVNATWDPQTDEIGAFEGLVGSHGGLGGEQTRPFLLYPADLPAPTEPLHGAESMHRLFVSWLAHLGHTAYASGEVRTGPSGEVRTGPATRESMPTTGG